MGKTTTKEVNIPNISIFVLFLCLLSKCCHYHVKNYIFALSAHFISTMTILEMYKCHYINNTQLSGWQSRLLPREIHCQPRREGGRADCYPEKFIVNQGEAEVDNEFLGVTICSTTLSAMCYLLYYTECSFLLVSFFFYDFDALNFNCCFLQMC